MKSCLAHWPEIVARIHAAPGLFIAFDYDGVLAPIAPRPALATMSSQNRALLDRLAKHPGLAVAIVSGRALADVQNQVNLGSLLYAGNHGAEIAWSGTIERHVPLELYRHHLVHVWKDLSSWSARFPGLRVEDKGFGIGLHYREIALDQLPLLHEHFAAWAKTLPEDLRVTAAKMMYEIRPKVEWNKGSAVLRLWEAVAPRSLPFCLGDDRTDEDGFIALQGKGINIFVGTTKESCAEYFLESTAEVTQFMELLHTEADRVFKAV